MPQKFFDLVKSSTTIKTTSSSRLEPQHSSVTKGSVIFPCYTPQYSLDLKERETILGSVTGENNASFGYIGVLGFKSAGTGSLYSSVVLATGSKPGKTGYKRFQLSNKKCNQCKCYIPQAHRCEKSVYVRRRKATLFRVHRLEPVS